ncbi:MAG: hypothetical protein K5866_00440 [Treponema sp.]|nr:hypothetical protein [Treponema sp.]
MEEHRNKLFKNVEEMRPDGEQPLHFYYNREERIARAPENVKAYYRGEMKPVRGFKVLFTKQNKYIFLSLIFFCASVLIYNGFNKSRNYALINHLDCEVQAFSFEEEVYVNLKIKRNKNAKDLSPKKVMAQIFMIDPNNNVSDKKVEYLDYQEGEQFIRAKFTDFDIIRVDLIVNVDGQEKELSTQVKH